MLVRGIYLFNECNTREVARRLNAPKSFIYKSIRDKRDPMPHYRNGRRYEFSWREVEAWF